MTRRSWLIPDVIEDWAQMDGETDLDKQVNALITARHVQQCMIPGNECITYVGPLDELWDAADPEESVRQIAQYLLRYFNYDVDGTHQTAELYARLRTGERLSVLAQTRSPFAG